MYTHEMLVLGNVAYRLWIMDGEFSHIELMIEGSDPRDR